MSSFDRAASTSSIPPSALPARHKYANLPDVDITAPDVYETPCVVKARRRKIKPSRKGDYDNEGRKTAGAADADDDEEEDDDGGYSFESQSDESFESSDDDTPYKIRKVPRGWTKAAPRIEIQSAEIERASLKQFEADKKFRNAVELDGSSADFSDKLKRNVRRCEAGNLSSGVRRGRDAGISTSTYQLGGGASTERNDHACESLADRVRRLKFEASLLEDEIAQASESSDAAVAGGGQKDGAVAGEPPQADAAAASGSKADEEVPLSELLSQLRILRSQLAQLDSSGSNAADAASTTKTRAAWEAQTKSLLQKLTDPAAAMRASASGTTADGPAEAAEQPASTHYDNKPSTSASDIGALDRRLAELEEALGVNEAMLDESKAAPKPILPTLSRLEQQLQLLSQPRHLDAISRRVKVLVTELDRVQDSKQKLLGSGNGGTLPLSLGSGSDHKHGIFSSSATTTAAGGAGGGGNSDHRGLTPDEVTKLNQLFTVSQRLDLLLPLIPTLLGRMMSLSDLHASSVHFAKTLDELEKRKQLHDKEDKEASEMMDSLEKSMGENSERMQTNLASLEERIASLTGRMEKLSSSSSSPSS